MSIVDMGGSPPQTIDLPAPGAGAGPPAVRDLISQVRQLADSDPDHVDKLLLEKARLCSRSTPPGSRSCPIRRWAQAQA